MTAVFEPVLSHRFPEVFNSRAMWAKSPAEIMPPHKQSSIALSEGIKHQGIYVFGGYNQHRECATNTVYVLKPAYTTMKKLFSTKSPNFKRLVKPKYSFELTELATTGGKAPSPRFGHSACMLGGRYLAIFGGRNDRLFSQVGNVALNDMHLLDLRALHWVTLALFCQDSVPVSRWGHRLVARENGCGAGAGDALFLFGGCNLKSYCEGSAIFEFVFSDQAAAQTLEENERELNQALNKT